jgi:hypothetical protein
MNKLVGYLLTPRFYVPLLALVTDGLLVFGVTLDPTIKTSLIGLVSSVGGWFALGLPGLKAGAPESPKPPTT